MFKEAVEKVVEFKKAHPLLFQFVLTCAVTCAVTFVASHGVLANTGGSEWQPLWNKLQGYVEGYLGMMAAVFFVLAGLIGFYRGQFAQGGIAILVAGGIFLAPTIATKLSGGVLF